MRYLTAFVLGISLLFAPAAITAKDHGRDKQKHKWKDQEKKHWRQYLKEQRKEDHEWEKASKKEQKAYWKWREAHPDTQ